MHTATATATAARIARADAASWGQAMAAAARSAAAVLVAVYTAGLVLGAWVHQLSAALATLASRPHQTTKPAPAAQHRPAPAVDRLTVREIRQLARQAGHRALARSGRRADLLQALAA
jgi:heme A synthase